MVGAEITVMIGDVKYIREDAVKTPVELGDKRIVVAERGWVFVGDCTDNEDGSVTIENTQNIRRWGTSRGLGELVNGPLTNTKYDPYGTVKTKSIAEIAVVKGW